MKLNKKYCALIDSDSGYDNQLLADCCVKIAEEFAIGFAEWICERADVPYIKGTMDTTLEIYKQEKGL
jgi:hypothetical protein